jgi:hypothetical protein
MSAIALLFHPAAIRDAMQGFTLPPAVVAARAKVQDWARQLGSKKLDTKKETELLPGFIEDVFKDALGYTRSPADPYTLKREQFIEVDDRFADAGLGLFSAKGDMFVAVLKGKGPKDPLARPFGSRTHSAVTQAALYALQLRIDGISSLKGNPTLLQATGHRPLRAIRDGQARRHRRRIRPVRVPARCRASRRRGREEPPRLAARGVVHSRARSHSRLLPRVSRPATPDVLGTPRPQLGRAAR